MAQSPPTLRAHLSNAVRSWAAARVAKEGDGGGIWGGAFSTFMGMSTSGGGPNEVKDNPADYARARTAESYVFTAEQVRSRSVSQVPLRCWQTDVHGKRKAIEHDALGILEATNPYGYVDGVPQLMRMTLGSLDFQGRACWQLAFDRRGIPSEVYWLLPTQWSPVPDKKMFFKGIKVRDDEGVREIPASQLCYFVTDNPLDPLLGTSRIAVLKNPINLRSYSQWNNIDFFKNSMRPDWMLSGSFANTEDNIERLRRGIRRMLSGANNRAPLILGEGMTAHLLTTSHEDAQWVEQQRLAQEEISAVFGVPLVYLNNLERSTYDNIKTAKLILWHDTMIPELDDLADRLNRRYLWRFWPETKGRKMTLGFDYDEIEGLGEDLALIWERVVKMSHQISEQVKQRELTPHQARTLRDQLFGDLGIETSAFTGTILGGDQFFAPFTEVPVDQLSIQAVMDVWAMRGQNPEFVENVPGAENADANAQDVLDRINKPPEPPALPPGAAPALPPGQKPPSTPGAPAAPKPPAPRPAAPAAPKSADELRAELHEQVETSRRLKRYFQDQQTAALRSIRQGWNGGDLYERGAFTARLKEIVGPALAREIEAHTLADLKRACSGGDELASLENRVRAVFRHAIDARADGLGGRKGQDNPVRPLHTQILEAEKHYARKVAHVLRAVLDPDAVARSWAPWAAQAKAGTDQPSDALMTQARSYAATLGLSLAELLDVFKTAYGDSWALGLGSAMQSMSASGFSAQPGVGAYAYASGIDWSTWKPGNQAAADQILGQNGGAGLQALLNDADVVIQGITDTTLSGIADVLGEGAARGDSIATIADALGAFLDDPSRAEMIARTELARGVGAATLDTYGFNGIEAKGWLTFNPCQLCARNEGAVVPLDAPFPSGDQMPPAHPHCLVGTTRVMPGDVEAWLPLDSVTGSAISERGGLTAAAVAEPKRDLSRLIRAATDRHYIGEIITIELACGYQLTGTANHPIATPRGWVALSELKVGDDVLRSTASEWEAPGIDPDVDHVHPTLQQVAQSLSVALGPMPTAAEDFHGDGAGSEVHVVRTNGLLRDEAAHTASHQKVSKVALGDGDVARVALNDERVTAPFLPASLSAPDGVVRGSGVSGSLLGAEAALVEGIGRFEAAPLDPSQDQEALKSLAADSEGFCERLLALSPEIATDRVVRVRREPFSGHVYNLDTEGGWYIGNGIITHNCRCALTPETLSSSSVTQLAARKELLYETGQRSPTHDHSTEAGERPTIVLDLHGTITPSDGFTAPDQPGSMLPPFEGCRESFDLLVAGGACLHLCTAALSPYHPPEILAARRKLIDAYLTAYGLPVSFVSGKVGGHVYYDDRMVRAEGDWKAIMARVLAKLDKRFEMDDAGIWRRKDIPDQGAPIDVFPDEEDTTPDQPRGLSTPVLDVDLHRCLFTASSSKLEGKLKPGALEAVKQLYSRYVVNLSCAGWDPATHPAVESAQRLASLRRQVRMAGVPYDEMVSKDHPDVSIDDKGIEHTTWKADLPLLLAALGTPHPEDEVTLRGDEPAGDAR